MRQGRTLQELAIEIDRQSKAKRDFIAPTGKMTFLPPKQASLELRLQEAAQDFFLGMGLGEGQLLKIGGHAHAQIADRLGIPRKFYDHLREEHQDILAANVNGLFRAHPEMRMVRTLDGTARAFLSDRYKRIDNDQVLRATLEAMKATGADVRVASCEVTDRRLYLKVVAPDIQSAVNYLKPGTHERVREPIRAGFIMTNSETGEGAFNFKPFVEVLSCTNGLIVVEWSSRAYHVGRRAEGGEDATELWADDTRASDDRTLLLKTRDTVRALLTKEQLDKVTARMDRAAESPIEGKIQDAVAELAQEHGLRDAESDDVLRHLIEGGDLSRWGLIQAVTRTAQDSPTYDRATELEELGGRLLAATA